MAESLSHDHNHSNSDDVDRRFNEIIHEEDIEEPQELRQWTGEDTAERREAIIMNLERSGMSLEDIAAFIDTYRHPEE